MKKENKIWIVSELYYPALISSGYYVTEIAEYLAKFKNNINVVCANSNYNVIKGVVFKKFEIHNNVRIHRILSKIEFNKNNLLQRILGFTINSIKFSFKIFFNVKRNDKLLVLTNPAFIIVFVYFISKIKRIKYMILVHDVFPENLISVELIKEKSISHKVLKYIFNKSYSNAEKIIAIGRDMRIKLLEKTKQVGKITIVTNWSDDEIIFPKTKDSTETFKKLPQDKLIIQFAGNLGRLQGIENVLKAIETTKNPNLHFVFIGTGAKENEIKKFISFHKPKNISYLGFLKRGVQNDFLNSCDIALITLSEGMYGLGVPSKAYNIMAAGKPMIVVAHPSSEISLCIKEEKIGWSIEPGNPEVLANLFDNLNMGNSILKDMGKRARNCAEKRFAKNIILKKYSDAILY